MGSSTLGPADGSLEVRTYREGVAQKVGHDLIIDVTGWSATVAADEAGTITSVALEVDPRSLRVREGLHGLKPLSDKDREDIRGNIDAKILGGRPIAFDSEDVEHTPGSLAVRGSLTIAGQTQPAAFALAVGPGGRATGTLTVTQSAFGIKPFRGLMGALKVRDDVELVLDVALPGG